VLAVELARSLRLKPWIAPIDAESPLLSSLRYVLGALSLGLVHLKRYASVPLEYSPVISSVKI
jgi:hypothetical protein